MDDLIGKCGRYLWSRDIEPADWILEEDYDAFVSQHSLGRIYHCVDVEGEFIVIKSKRDQSYRVNPEGFQTVPSTDFYVGDEVKVLNGSQSGKVGVIAGLGWHSNKEKIIYTLEVDGKRRSRQYWEEDIGLNA